MKTIDKVLNPCKYTHYNGEKYNTFVHVQYDGKRLSITGVQAPNRYGGCLGSCGQIVNDLESENPCKGWNSEMVAFLQDIWNAYHLNDLQEGCEHQREMGKTYTTSQGHKCLICGYKIGTAWKIKRVPANVIKWLESLPVSEIQPAWV